MLTNAVNGLHYTPPVLDENFDTERNILEVFEHGTGLNGRGISKGRALVGDG